MRCRSAFPGQHQYRRDMRVALTMEDFWLMAEQIEPIDTIARRVMRDVLYLAFVNDEGEPRDVYSDASEVTAWLDAQGIAWERCMAFGEDDVWIEGGPGCLYLDVPISPKTDALRRLEEYFMDADGRPAIPGYLPCLLQIDEALKFGYRDDPSYWDNF